MTGRIAICLAAALSGCLGCRDTSIGNPHPPREHELSTIERQVGNRVLVLTSSDNEYGRQKRMYAVVQSGILANDPELTPELRAKLIDALEKRLALEKDEEILKAANESLARLRETKANSPAR